MSGYIKYNGEHREISHQWGDIYLCGDEYRIGDPLNGVPIKSYTKHGTMLRYLLEHIGEKISYEELGDISGSKDPRGMMVSLKCQMRSSQKFRFVKRPTSDGSCVKLEERV
ncbi:hypothetical protein HY496_02290 [Candidatus Woesearchaeota archaeon]|nr:hypothetical protein [Candidatus Woesearchaeota archaeon]